VGGQPVSPRVRLALTPRLERRVRKLTGQDRRRLARALHLFQAAPHDPRLGTHELMGLLAEKWAFSFGHDGRVVFEWDGDIAVLLNARSHDEVYG